MAITKVSCVQAVTSTQASCQPTTLHTMLQPAITLILSRLSCLVFFNEEGFDFIGLWTHNVELSMATFVQLIEQIMRKLCSWH